MQAVYPVDVVHELGNDLLNGELPRVRKVVVRRTSETNVNALMKNIICDSIILGLSKNCYFIWALTIAQIYFIMIFFCVIQTVLELAVIFISLTTDIVALLRKPRKVFSTLVQCLDSTMRCSPNSVRINSLWMPRAKDCRYAPSNAHHSNLNLLGSRRTEARHPKTFKLLKLGIPLKSSSVGSSSAAEWCISLQTKTECLNAIAQKHFGNKAWIKMVRADSTRVRFTLSMNAFSSRVQTGENIFIMSKSWNVFASDSYFSSTGMSCRSLVKGGHFIIFWDSSTYIL